MINILFLDIDGVLNTPTWLNERSLELLTDPSDIMLSCDSGVGFIPETIEQLERIVQHDVSIVISSSWRDLFCWTELIVIFAEHSKIVANAIIDVIPKLPGIRGSEIEQFLNNFGKPCNFVIVDDCDDFFDHQQSRFVQTDINVGLTAENADKIIDIFQNKNK